jgi:hypothetical protein
MSAAKEETMTDQTYPEPFGEAFSYSSQRAAQLTSLYIALTQAFMQYRARRQHQQAVRDQAMAAEAARAEHAARRHAQAAWSPPHNPAWLNRADLLATARTWGAAMPYAPGDPSAAAALRACEDRLRTLHPYAMARYDRLRAEGASPFEAMREAVPLFARHPDPRPGQAAPARHPLDAVPAAGEPGSQQPGPEPPDTSPAPAATMAAGDQAEARGQQIIARLQARARDTGRPALGADELVTVLEAMTTLPPEVITRLTRPARTTPAATASGERSPVALAAESFPRSVTDAVRAGAAAAAQGGLPAAVRTVTERPLRRPGLSR